MPLHHRLHEFSFPSWLLEVTTSMVPAVRL